MKDNNSHNISEKNLAVWNDPELEVRLIAMLMGELSPFEEADMEQELERSPELRLFRDRMIKVMGLVTEVNQQDANIADDDHNDDDAWSLSPERRGVLLENFAESKSKGKSISPQASIISTAKIQWRNISSIAACLLVSLVAFKMMFVRKSPAFINKEELVSYSSAAEEGTEIMGQREVIPGFHKSPEEGTNFETRSKSLALEIEPSTRGEVFKKSESENDSVVTQDMEGGLKNKEEFFAREESAGLDMNQERVSKPEISNEVAKKPSAPSSSLAKVIAAGAPGSEHIPVPEVAVNEPSLDYGDGDAFDDGFGKGSGNGRGRQADEKGKEVLKDNQRSKLADLDGLTNGESSELDPFGDSEIVDSIEGDSIEDKLDIPTLRTQGTTYGVAAGIGGMDNGLVEQSSASTTSKDASLADVREGGIKSDLSNLSEVDKKRETVELLNANSTSTGAWKSHAAEGKDTGRYAWHVEDESEKLKTWRDSGQPSDSDITLKGDRRNYRSDDTNSLFSKEIARRELQINEADEKILKGREAQSGEDYETAVTKYKEALNQLPQGPIAREKREAYTKDLVDSSLALSEQYRRTGKYDEAEKLLDGVLEKDPGNVAAKKQREYLDDPIRTSPTYTYEHVENVEKVRKQLYTANSYYDQAQFDQANEEYKAVLKTDPYNVAARRGMEKVNAAKSDYYRAANDQTKAAMLMEVDKAWEIVAPPAEIKAKMREGNLANDKQAITRKKLSSIQLPLVEFEDDATVRDAVNFLRLRARELDSSELSGGQKGLNIDLIDENIGDIKLGGLKIKDVPMDEALRQIVQMTGLRYKVTGDRIDLMSATDVGGVDSSEMTTRTFRVAPDFIESLKIRDKKEYDGDPFSDYGSSDEDITLKELLRSKGISFPDGSDVGYSAARGTITVRNAAVLLDDMENLVNSFKSKEKSIPDFTKEISASEQTHSTFSLNVSDVSYQLAKSVLLENSGVLEADKIRVEEFVNAFDYGDPSASDKKVNCVVEQCAHPFYQQRNLIRVGMKTGAMGRTQPLRLTILLDNSGSMEREDRAATVVKAMEALAKQLGPQDEVTLMSFARDARLLAQKVKGNEAMQLVDMVKAIPSEGGTNISRAIEQAYGVAQQSVQEGTMSRIVVITDGAANLGNANPEDLAKSIEQMRQNGIAFDACGVGADGLDDDMLEALTRKGDGRYYFINRPEDADAGFAQKLAGALRPAAKNVKVQVVFNPERVGNYRLIGFEKHRLEKEDFRNDAVDAAEMAAEEAGNALYQVEARPDGKGDVATVFVRFQDMASGQMVERSWSIPYQSNVAGINSATPSMQLATAAGMLGERLKLGEQAGIDLKELNPILAELRSHYHSDQEVKDLIRMCEKVSE